MKEYRCWREVVAEEDDPAAVLARLYVEELARLAREAGHRVEAHWDSAPELVMAALADEEGWVDGGLLNLAEERAFNRYRREYAWRLGPVDDEDEIIERYKQICWANGL